MKTSGTAIATLATLAVLAMATSASAYRTKAGMIAVADPSASGVFEVYKKPGAGPSEYWCAAGDFAMRGLGLSGSTRLYILRGPGPASTDPRRTAVRFTYAPGSDVMAAAQGVQGNSLSITRAGSNLPAAHGRSLCPQASDRRSRD